MSDRDSREEWESRGKQTTWEKASEIVKQVTASRGYSLPDTIRNRILAEITGIVS
ncbi:hypothetical protein ACFLWS_06610 [Chloroflexota bacterium]